MAGPVNLNQVLFQTPTVEKVHQIEHSNPEQMSRHALQEEQVKLRERTETVQTSVEPDNSRTVENEKKKKEEERRKRKRQASEREETGEEEAETQPRKPGSGVIVDVVI